MYKSFHNEDQARIWLAQKKAEMADADEIGSLTDKDEDSMVTGVTYEKEAPNIARTQTPLPPIPEVTGHLPVDFNTIGPDPSVGKSEEIYKTSTKIERHVLDLLCPRGVTPEVQRELMECAPDVASLPSKYKSASGEGIGMDWDGLANVLGDLAYTQRTKLGTQIRDTQWKAENRNGADLIKDYDDLKEGSEELHLIRPKVIANMKSGFMESLHAHGWTEAEAMLWCETGLLPRIILMTFENYQAWFTHINNLANKGTDYWDPIAKPHWQ
jgi:hypothetical protein